MKVSVIRADELDPAARARWRELQASNPALGSPYFCVEFTRAVAGVRDDVRVAVIEDGGAVMGFFPHQRRFGVGAPVGGPLSDHHGVIASPGASWDWQRLLQGAGLAWWQFDHLAASQSPGLDVTPASSPALDLSRGFDAWKERRLIAGCRRVAELDRKARKLGREIGPLRFVPHVDDRTVFLSVLRLKSEQCKRSHLPDVFALPWARALVDNITATDDVDFAGRLSALYAGDTLVAAHLGMRSRRSWHWWFPVYHAHAKHSPGGVLLLHVAAAAAAEGVELLDLGKGDDVYKQSFADCGIPLVEGCVGRPVLLNAAREARELTTQFLKTSPLTQRLRPLLRSVRRWRQRPIPVPTAHRGPSLVVVADG